MQQFHGQRFSFQRLTDSLSQLSYNNIKLVNVVAESKKLTDSLKENKNLPELFRMISSFIQLVSMKYKEEPGSDAQEYINYAEDVNIHAVTPVSIIVPSEAFKP